MRKMIPNILTFGNLYCGVLSIGMVIKGDIANATTLIFIALLLDALDGRVARMLKVNNDLGKELDSLADVVTFGVAPAILVWQTFLVEWGTIGLAIAALFPIYGCYRLARFNVQDNKVSLSYFRGLPITAAGGIVALMVVFYEQINLWIFLIIFLALAQLMISVVKIPSFKSGVKRSSILLALFAIYLVFAMATNYIHGKPVLMYAVVLVAYMLLIVLYQKRIKTRKKLNDRIFKKSIFKKSKSE